MLKNMLAELDESKVLDFKDLLSTYFSISLEDL